MKPRLALVGAMATAIALAPTADAYLRLGTAVGAGIVAVKWNQLPIRYFITNRDVPGVTAVDLQAALQHAFDTWNTVPTASLSSAFVGFTSAEPGVDDGMSVIGFRARPELDRILAETTFQVDSLTGTLIESDIFINSSFNWSVAPGGEPLKYDVQSIVTHEVGHLHGLSHSALGETELRPDGTHHVLAKDAVMFPIAYPAGNIADRALKADDIAGISDIYPTAAFLRQTGQIGGRVTQNGVGVFGAHIVAFNPVTGALVGGFSLDAGGHFTISGLTPGLYVVRAEPLDDADLDSFFDPTTTTVNINFVPAYASALVAVPASGSSAPVQIQVTVK
jgi:hypothetical protein